MLQASHDAHDAATTREQRVAHERNEAVWLALMLIKEGHPERAHALLCLSVAKQCHLEGVTL